MKKEGEVGVLVYIAVCGLMGMWSASIWEKKGGSKGAGWAFGLLLGIFGVLAAALFMPSHRTTRPAFRA